MSQTANKPKRGLWAVVYGSVHGDAINYGLIVEWDVKEECGYIFSEATEAPAFVRSNGIGVFLTKEEAQKEYNEDSFEGYLKERNSF